MPYRFKACCSCYALDKNMSPELVHTIKIVFGTLVIIGLVINFFERWFSPHTLLLESSPSFPSWLGWLGWSVAATATIGYFALDVLS